MILQDTLTQLILAHYPEAESSDIQCTVPPTPELGDLSIPMFLLAKRLRKAPALLAGEAAREIDFSQIAESATAAGPYLNLTLKRGSFAQQLLAQALAKEEKWGSNGIGKGLQVLIEHTSINPNASPHVGRGRCAMIGDSLVRLLRFEDYEVDVHYYVNDMGRQIGLLVLMMEEVEKASFDEILDIYVKANARAEADPEFAARGYELLARIEAGDEEVRRRFFEVTEMCLQGQLAVLRRIGARYDFFDHESDYVNDPRIAEVEKALENKGALFTDEEERRVVDLSKLGHALEEGRYFVLRRANGSSMYGCRDIAYSIMKHEKGADLNLMVLGEDHKLYAQQLALILEAAGYPAPETIYYSYILLKDGKMSTRGGKVVLLDDVLNQATALALERVTEQFPGLDERERVDIASQVAVAAIRFAVLRVKSTKNVVFDMQSALSFQGDTGPYIQYCCARIRSILRKWDAALPDCDSFVPEFQEEAEWRLVLKTAEFPDVVKDALNQRSCAGIGNYLLDLAHAFTSFYHECPVLTAQSTEQRMSRILLCAAVLQSLTNGLALLGIDAPERM
ncbi:MAG: arginine--tRNA ligase [Candidatus Hydrogenedens sp.]|nr:arginine--tRNA ligase [Candidatus Hydrogenedens sp.]